MRYVNRKTEKIQVPEEFRLPGTDIIVEAGDVLEVEFVEKKKAEQDGEEDTMDNEDGQEDTPPEENAKEAAGKKKK